MQSMNTLVSIHIINAVSYIYIQLRTEDRERLRPISFVRNHFLSTTL